MRNAQLSDQGLIKLGLLEAGTTVQEGDIIVTSGIGGKFPKDLLIGKAVEVKPEENDVSLYATVEPFVDIKTVRDVIIITSFNGQGEVGYKQRFLQWRVSHETFSSIKIHCIYH